jgi:hypothetical protein
MHVILRSSLVVAALIVLAPIASARTAKPSELAVIKPVVSAGLRDPESARFRSVRFGAGENSSLVCGEVNAKNGFGGYAGFTTFVGMYFGPEDFDGEGGKPVFVLLRIDDEPGDVASAMCAEKGV